MPSQIIPASASSFASLPLPDAESASGGTFTSGDLPLAENRNHPETSPTGARGAAGPAGFFEELRDSQNRAMDSQGVRLKLEKKMPDQAVAQTSSAQETPGFGTATPGFSSFTPGTPASRIGSVASTPGCYLAGSQTFGNQNPLPGAVGHPLSPWMGQIKEDEVLRDDPSRPGQAVDFDNPSFNPAFQGGGNVGDVEDTAASDKTNGAKDAEGAKDALKELEDTVIGEGKMNLSSLLSPGSNALDETFGDHFGNRPELFRAQGTGDFGNLGDAGNDGGGGGGLGGLGGDGSGTNGSNGSSRAKSKSKSKKEKEKEKEKEKGSKIENVDLNAAAAKLLEGGGGGSGTASHASGSTPPLQINANKEALGFSFSGFSENEILETENALNAATALTALPNAANAAKDAKQSKSTNFRYRIGEKVDYWSYSRNCWQPGRIIERVPDTDDQIYVVDKKPPPPSSSPSNPEKREKKNFFFQKKGSSTGEHTGVLKHSVFHCKVWVGEIMSRKELGSNRILNLLERHLKEEYAKIRIVRTDMSSDSDSSEDSGGNSLQGGKKPVYDPDEE